MSILNQLRRKVIFLPAYSFFFRNYHYILYEYIFYNYTETYHTLIHFDARTLSINTSNNLAAHLYQIVSNTSTDLTLSRKAHFPRSHERDAGSLRVRFSHRLANCIRASMCSRGEWSSPYYFPCRASLKRWRVTLAANESIFRFRSLSVSTRPGAECIHGRY